MASGWSLDFDYGNKAFSDPFADFSGILDDEKMSVSQSNLLLTRKGPRIYFGLAGLAGSSSLMSTHVVMPSAAAPAIPIAMGELRTPPLAPGDAPASRLRFFRLPLSVELSEDSSRVVS